MQITDTMIENAKNGPHKGWDTFDIQNEGVRFHLIDIMIDRKEATIEELNEVASEVVRMAQSYGYASADTALNISDNDEEGQIIKEDILENYMSDGEYDNQVDVSISRLIKISDGNLEYKEFVNKFLVDIKNAVEKGIEMKKSEVLTPDLNVSKFN